MFKIIFASFFLVLSTYSFDINSLKKAKEIPPKKFDWIILDSNEVLKGEIITLYQDEVEFDSDELGILSLDIDDIAIIKTYRTMSVRLNDGTITRGRLVLDENKMTIYSPGKVSVFKRSRLNTIARTSKKEAGLWDGDITLSFDLSDGNTESVDFSTSIELRRLTASSRFKLSYLTQFSTISGDQTDNNHKVNTTLDNFYSNNIFIRLADLEYFNDRFQNIDSRVTAGVSLGYIILENDKHDLDISIGPSIQLTNFRDVAAGQGSKKTSPVLQVTMDYEYELTKNVDFEFSYRVKYVKKDSGNRLHNLRTAFEIEVIDDFDIDIIGILDRVEEPTETSTGETPQKNDYSLSFGISYEF